MKKRLRQAGLILASLLVLALLAGGGGFLVLRGRLMASLPSLDGTVRLEGLSSPVHVARDALGVPSIRAADRLDLARATGFVHAQERFFQMDLQRRRAAGELAELLGPPALPADRAVRVHRFRTRARRNHEAAPSRLRALTEAYASGVNAGLAALGDVPPEYLLLRAEPAPWSPEDTVLTVMTMYLRLQDERGVREASLGVLYDVLPTPLADFLAPAGTEWDAPVVGEPFAGPPVPGPEVFDLRSDRPASAVAASAGHDDAPAGAVAGSNGWVVAGSRTRSGRAILANDMHLGLGLPNIWYRASLVWTDGAGRSRRATGVMLPGAPAMIAGSNERVAWGHTNSYGDFSDLVVIEPDPEDERRYLAPGGPRSFERHEERIAVKNGEDEVVWVEETIWGPVVDTDHLGRRVALRWTAHDIDGVDMALVDLETAEDVDEALRLASRCGVPGQNFVAADRSGRIGWTLLGPIRRRIGFDGRVPTSWADGRRRWGERLAPEEYPRVVDPAAGALWTANNRVVDGTMLARLGDGGYALGARAGQARDALLALERASEADLLAVQLDDRARFLERWRALALDATSDDAVAGDPRRAAFREHVRTGWSRRASVDSVGYRLVRAFRLNLARQVFGAITAACREADEEFRFFRIGQWEGPLWRLVSERPAHLLPPERESWDDQLLAAVDATLDELLAEDGTDLRRKTWGDRNTVRLRHPLSRAVPALSRWLDLPPRPLPGDSHMPRVQAPEFGASDRMVVSPGLEERGIFHMPGGQSGHPFSPFYRRGHETWEAGEPAPFLPGPTVYNLDLIPAS